MIQRYLNLAAWVLRGWAGPFGIWANNRVRPGSTWPYTLGGEE